MVLLPQGRQFLYKLEKLSIRGGCGGGRWRIDPQFFRLLQLTLVLGLFLHTVLFREIYEKNKIGLKMNPQFCQLQTRFHKFVSFKSTTWQHPPEYQVLPSP